MSAKRGMVALGLNDLSHFVRDLKHTFGESPSELRKKTEDARPANVDEEPEMKPKLPAAS